MLKCLPHLTVKASALQCHVDDRRDEWEAVADRSWFLRILRETEESDQQYIGCGSNAGGDFENGRHAKCVVASFPACNQGAGVDDELRNRSAMPKKTEGAK